MEVACGDLRTHWASRHLSGVRGTRARQAGRHTITASRLLFSLFVSFRQTGRFDFRALHFFTFRGWGRARATQE